MTSGAVCSFADFPSSFEVQIDVHGHGILKAKWGEEISLQHFIHLPALMCDTYLVQVWSLTCWLTSVWASSVRWCRESVGWKSRAEKGRRSCWSAIDKPDTSRGGTHGRRLQTRPGQIKSDQTRSVQVRSEWAKSLSLSSFFIVFSKTETWYNWGNDDKMFFCESTMDKSWCCIRYSDF